MDQLWPTDPAGVHQPSEDDLRALYAFPVRLDRPWIKVNFISSADGAATVQGRSGGLGDANDKRIFLLGRELCDVVLVGAGTALTERYRGITRKAMAGGNRAELGLAPVPTIAVVTRQCSILPTSPLVTESEVPPIIYTAESADPDRRAALAEAGASVIITGKDDVDLTIVVADLAQRGLQRVNCEGGPRLFGSLLAAELVDELCLSIAPLLTSGDSGRISVGHLPPKPIHLRLASILHADDLLLLRYVR